MPEPLKHALRAILWGTLASGGPFMVFTAIFALDVAGDSAMDALLLMFLPMLIAGAVIIPAFIVLGLPLTALLKRLRRETRRAYALSGMVGGMLTPFVAAPILFGEYTMDASMLIAVPGGLGGFVTAWIWGGWREKTAAVDTEMLREAFD